MATLSYPGVYVQEVSSGVRPIELASTSTAAFVGIAEMGPDDDAKRITSWAEFQKYYGAFISNHFLAHSVFQYFNNGGRQCYIVRVIGENAKAASVTVRNRALSNNPLDSIIISAKSKGIWGNYLCLQIENGSFDPENEFKISVRRQIEDDVIPDNFLDMPPLEVHDNLSIDENAKNYVETVIKQRSDLIDIRVLDKTSKQAGIHRGGLLKEPSVKLDTHRKFQINLDNDGFQTVTIPPPVNNAAENLATIATAITDAVKGLKKKKVSTPIAAFEGFTCKVDTVNGIQRLLLQSGSTDNLKSSVLILDASENNAAAPLKLGEANGGRSQYAWAVRRPADADVIQVGDAAPSTDGPVSRVEPGSDGDSNQLNSELIFRDAFKHLDNKTDFSLLAVPGQNSPVMVNEGMAYCQGRPLQDVFYIGEMTQDDDKPGDGEAFRMQLTKPNSYGAVYFPWIKALDPSGKSAEPILLPPSGYIAGLYARTDATRGVWKAPAGTEASLSGAIGLARELIDTEHGNLDVRNINVIRRFPASGIVSFGANTITSSAEWKYVPVRRMAIMLRVSIYYGIQWAVFEPNDEGLWSQLRLNLNSFMMTLFRQGAFQGSSPSQAFYVKCDSETTSQADIDLGIVNVKVGFAPLKPAVFVVVNISQKAGQS